MSYDKIENPVISDKYKSMTCQANDCLYNTRPGCNGEWVELDASGKCIFKTTEPLEKVVTHPITGDKFTILLTSR